MERLKLIYGWLLETPASERDSYHSWLCLWRHIIFGLIFQYVRMCTTMTPIEARDRILIRLQKGYYPLRQDSAWLCLGIRALILARYSWLAAKMLFLELYFLNFLFWKSHDYARRKDILPQLTRLFSPGFHRLAVLAPSPASQVRHAIAKMIAITWYLWAKSFPFPLLTWVAFTVVNELISCSGMKVTVV
jgi:hypothetical protein